jgi:uncharacterized membrane protein YgdD (TMEM256/DUF423 family)
MHLKRQLLLASIFGLTGVIILAMAAHYLQSILMEEQINAIKTAANLQLIHGVVIFSLYQLVTPSNLIALKRAINFMILGIIAFSGSIYLLSFKTVYGLSWLKVFWPITPIGGLILILSWVMVSIQIYKSKQ